MSFNDCMKITENNKDAIGCCMKGCDNNPNCQEQCIESYNTLIPVKERFIFGYRVSKKLLFLTAVIFFHILSITGRVKIPYQQNKAILSIVMVYCTLYYMIFYVL